MSGKYIIHNGKRPLSYFFGNGNGKVKDIIGFGWKSYFQYGSEKEAFEHIEYMKKQIRERDDFDLKLSIKLFNLFDKLKIKEVQK